METLEIILAFKLVEVVVVIFEGDNYRVSRNSDEFVVDFEGVRLNTDGLIQVHFDETQRF